MNEFSIKGLAVISEFVSTAEGNELLSLIDEGEWITVLKRRVQHFGYRYLYSSKRVAPLAAPPMPIWAIRILSKLRAGRIVSQGFDQLIVNEYYPGQGIAPHIDSLLCFDNEIVSLSLGSSCVIVFSPKSKAARFELMLRPGDLLVMRNEARYLWRHEIAPRKSDRWEGEVIGRTRRLSLTFRTLLQ